MNEWMAFFLSLWTNAVTFMETWTIFGVPIIGFIVGVFVVGVLLRALLVKA